MRIGRLEFGLITFYKSQPKFRLRYFYSHCLCRCVEFWRFYITWLSDECLNNTIEYGDEDI